MRIATWNVNGIRARGEQVLAWIQSETPDVVCLQEIKASPAQVPAALLNLDDYWSYWHGTKGYSGVALLVRKGLCPECPMFTNPEFDFEDRIVAMRVQGVVIASVYLPNGGKDFPAKLRFMEALSEFADLFHAKGDPIVL
ncbi:MAG: exodeoxyribonuclease III, partial [Chthoniobacteraceae bacterium]